MWPQLQKSPFRYPTQLVTPGANRYRKKIVFKLAVHASSYYESHTYMEPTLTALRRLIHVTLMLTSLTRHYYYCHCVDENTVVGSGSAGAWSFTTLLMNGKRLGACFQTRSITICVWCSWAPKCNQYLLFFNKIQVDHPLSTMLGTLSMSDVRSLQILKYLHVYDEIS